MESNHYRHKWLKDLYSDGVALFWIFILSVVLFIVIHRHPFQKPYVFITGPLFVVSLGCLLVAGIKQHKLVKLSERYRTHIFENHMYSYLELAQAENRDIGTVRDNLRYMIEQKLITDIELDDSNRQVVLVENADQHDPSDEDPEENLEYEASSGDCCEDSEPEEAAEPVTTVECPSCGAPSTLTKGKRHFCDYCGNTFVLEEDHNGSSE